VVFLLSFVVSASSSFEPLSITVFPTVPKEGSPLIVFIELNNPFSHQSTVSYELYANSKLVMKGSESLQPESGKQIVYVYPESPGLGERTLFLLRGSSGGERYEKALSLPSYPPQVWSSFVSFASFSTSLLGSSLGFSMGSSMGSSMGTAIASMQYYNNLFLNAASLNIGLLFSLTLISLLIFLELTEPLNTRRYEIMGLRLRFTRLSVVLLAVFMGMVLTKVVMVIR